MLKETLNILSSSKAFSIENISKELGISTNMAEDIIFQLERMNYIKKSKLDTCSTNTCRSCPYASSCNKEIISYYNITDKGINYLNKIK